MSTVVLKKLTLANCNPEGIAQIIKEKKYAKDLNYRAFLYLLRTSNSAQDKTTFLAIVRNISLVVALFDRDCEDVFQEIIRLPWELEDAGYRETVKHFLIALMSSQPSYTNKIIDRTIQKFSLLDTSDKVVAHQTNLEILQFASDNMPVYMKFIRQKLVSNFPHKSKPLLDHQAYITNILKLSEMIPAYFNDVIMTIVEKLVKIDVEITSSPHTAESDHLFSFDEERSNKEDETSDKLDTLLTDFLGYARTHSSAKEESASLWCKVMLLSFDSHILKAHVPPNVPFIMFYFFNIHPELKTVLLDYFWSVFADNNKPAIIRQSGIMYLGSFTNRSRSVKKADFKKIMLTISTWCHSYIENNDGLSLKCNHSVFYSACQSLFYMFCYRHKDLFSSAEHSMFLDKVNLHGIVHCKLNPLRQCSSHILRLFNQLTSMYEIVTCSVVIQRNSRSLLPSSLQFGNEEYPFRPCLLKALSSVVEPHFRDMECASELKSEVRKYKVSENFEDWDHVISDVSIALTPDFQSMSVE